MEENKLFCARNKFPKGLILHTCRFFGCADSNGTGFEPVHSNVSELWTISMHSLGNC